ncbi:MAG TPA: energy-coupling factor transporter transmembrane component T [Bacteroidota bacterium]|nr:energy-coupling factor transporter transmembrane component T [Bacteroidota bacterium]
MSQTVPDKLAFVLFCWTCAFLLPWEVSFAGVLLLLVASSVVPDLQPRTQPGTLYVKRFLLYAAPLVLVLIIANGLLLREGPVLIQTGFFSFYEGGFSYALTVSGRLVLLSLSTLLFFVSTPVRDIVEQAETAGLPHSLVSIILLSLFFLEQIPRRISNIFTAQEARGAPVRKGLTSRVRSLFFILSPLLLSSIVESVERGVALELRGYHQRRPAQRRGVTSGRLHVWGISFILLSIMIIAEAIIRWLRK